MFNNLTENESYNQDEPLEILFFTSPLCGPCPKIERRLLETIAKKKLPIKVTKIDILSTPEIAEEHNIVVCPTLIFRDYMTVCGSYEAEILEELISNFFAFAFEFKAPR
ncbi:MAG: thioredoxin family protein [Promethearchaeota archaeon]